MASFSRVVIVVNVTSPASQTSATSRGIVSTMQILVTCLFSSCIVGIMEGGQRTCQQRYIQCNSKLRTMQKVITITFDITIIYTIGAEALLDSNANSVFAFQKRETSKIFYSNPDHDL